MSDFVMFEMSYTLQNKGITRMKKELKALIENEIPLCLLTGGTAALSAYSGRADIIENTF